MRKIISATVLAVFAVDLLGSAGDSTMTWSSPMYDKLYSNDSSKNPLGKPITPEEDSWIGSLINIGAIVSPYFYGFLAAKVGRKIALLSLAIPHFVSYISMAFANKVWVYYFGRLLGGFGVGGGYTLIPMYIAEITEDSNRGLFSVSLNIFLCLGNLIPYLIGPYISALWLNLALSCLPMAFFILFIIVAPETPYYLMSVNKEEKAEQALLHLRSCNKEEIKEELSKIKKTIEVESSGKLSDIFKVSYLRKALFISVMLVAFQQLSGINAILFYAQPLFSAIASDIPPEVSSIILGLVLFMSSFLPPYFSDRWGRRPLLICSCLGMILALTGIGTFFYFQDQLKADVEKVSWLPIVCLVGYIIFFNLGIGPLPWTISSELFPSNVKSISASAVSSSCWLISFIVTKFFNSMVAGLNISGTFWFYAGFCAVAAIFSIILVPETKNKSFLQIQEMLDK